LRAQLSSNQLLPGCPRAIQSSWVSLFVMPYKFAFASYYECSVYSHHVSEMEVLKEHIGISIGT